MTTREQARLVDGSHRDRQTKEAEMRTLAVTGVVSGVGASTTAVHLAHGLARIGKTVLLVDTDPQGTATDMLGADRSNGLATLLIDGGNPQGLLQSAREGVALLTGGSALVDAARRIEERGARERYHILREGLIPLSGKFDFAILDAPPGWTSLTANVMYCADEIVLPVSVRKEPVEHLQITRTRIDRIQQFHPDLRLRYVLPTFLVENNLDASDEGRNLRKEAGGRLLHPIRKDDQFLEARTRGQTVFEHASRSTGAEDYRRVIAQVLVGV